MNPRACQLGLKLTDLILVHRSGIGELLPELTRSLLVLRELVLVRLAELLELPLVRLGELLELMLLLVAQFLELVREILGVQALQLVPRLV